MSEHSNHVLDDYVAQLLNDGSERQKAITQPAFLNEREQPFVAKKSGRIEPPQSPDKKQPALENFPLAADERVKLQQLLASNVSLPAVEHLKPLPDTIAAPAKPKISAPLKKAPGKVAERIEHTVIADEVNGQAGGSEDNGRPLWAQKELDVLLVQVNGLTLALPLIFLGKIYKLDQKLTALPGQPDWCMGLFALADKSIVVVNTALYVMPAHCSKDWPLSTKFLVTIENSRWGLAVDEVRQPTRIQPDDVTWRGQRGTRPWLAGTVKAALCALLDIPNMRNLFT